MALVLNGTTGVSAVQDGVVTTPKLGDGAVTPAKTQVGALPSMIKVNNANAYGSTNTKIRRFGNITDGVNGCIIRGTDITITDSATLGTSFTVNVAGTYAISYSDQFSSVADFGLSVNTTQPAIVVYLIPLAEILSAATSGSTSWGAFTGWTGYLAAGSIVRAHTGGTSSGANTGLSQFTIARVA